eukprot:tig00021721_g23222.t1
MPAAFEAVGASRPPAPAAAPSRSPKRRSAAAAGSLLGPPWPPASRPAPRRPRPLPPRHPPRLPARLAPAALALLAGPEPAASLGTIGLPASAPVEGDWEAGRGGAGGARPRPGGLASAPASRPGSPPRAPPPASGPPARAPRGGSPVLALGVGHGFLREAPARPTSLSTPTSPVLGGSAGSRSQSAGSAMGGTDSPPFLGGALSGAGGAVSPGGGVQLQLAGIFSRRRRSSSASTGASSLGGSGASAANLLRHLPEPPPGDEGEAEGGAGGEGAGCEGRHASGPELEEGQQPQAAPAPPEPRPEPPLHPARAPALELAPGPQPRPRPGGRRPTPRARRWGRSGAGPRAGAPRRPAGPARPRASPRRSLQSARSNSGAGSGSGASSPGAGREAVLESGRAVRGKVAPGRTCRYSLSCPLQTPGLVSVQALRGAVDATIRFVPDRGGEPPPGSGPWTLASTEEEGAELAVPPFGLAGSLAIALRSATGAGAAFALAAVCETPAALKIGRPLDRALAPGDSGAPRPLLPPSGRRRLIPPRSLSALDREGSRGRGGQRGGGGADGGRGGLERLGGERVGGGPGGRPPPPPVAAYFSCTRPYPTPEEHDFALTPSRPRAVVPCQGLGDTLYVAVLPHRRDRRPLAAAAAPRPAPRPYTLSASILKSSARVAGMFISKSLFAHAASALSQNARGSGSAAPSASFARPSASLRAAGVRSYDSADESRPAAPAPGPGSRRWHAALLRPRPRGPAPPRSRPFLPTPTPPERPAAVAWAPDPTDLPYP